MGELIKGAVRSLRRKRNRTVLTVIGIAVGVMMVSVVSVIGAAGEDVVDRELDSMGVGGLSVMAQTGGEQISEEALERLRSLSCVTSAMPLMVQIGSVSTVKNTCESALCGIDAGAGQVISLNLLHGRMITRGDVATAAAVCMIDETLAQDLYGRENIVGKPLTVQFGETTETVTVIGVTETGSSLLQNFTSMIPGMLYLPYTTAGNITGQSKFDQVAVRVSGETDTAKRRVEQTLDRLYDGNAPFRTDDLAVQKERLEGIVSIVTWILTAISAISLLVSGFSIMTVMLSAVGERTREIGIKKAIGATRGRILAEFLTESILLSGAGALVGLLPSVLLTVVLRAVGLSSGVPIGVFVVLILFSLAVGCVFGAYPAYKASNLQPVEALRSE